MNADLGRGVFGVFLLAVAAGAESGGGVEPQKRAVAFENQFLNLFLCEVVEFFAEGDYQLSGIGIGADEIVKRRARDREFAGDGADVAVSSPRRFAGEGSSL